MPTSTLVSIVVMVIIAVVVVVYTRVLRKKMGGMPGQAPLGGPEAARVRGDLKRGDLSSLKQLLEQGGADDRDFFCDLRAGKARQPLLDQWCAQEPGSAVARLVRGRALVERAWDARGHGTADSVDDRGWELFFDYLKQAEQELQRAAELDAGDPTPWAFLIEVARGLQQDKEVARRRFQEAVRRDPEHWGAHSQMLSFLCKKWHGSHEEMFDFARRASSQAGEGSDLGTLVIKAHIERWLYYSFDDDKKGAAGYLKDAAAVQECQAAYARSLASAQLRVRRSTILARNTAAMWFFLVRDKQHLRLEIPHIGNAYSNYPWCYWDEPAKAYGEASQYAYGVL
jgi:hypothetical protein